MKWFKHYHNASSSLKLQSLRNRKRGKEAYCEYWMLLELLCEKFDGEDTKIKLSWKEVGTKLEVRSNRVGTILELYASLNLIELVSVGTELEINAPILLELKDKDFTRARKEREVSAQNPRTKSAKNKNKNKEEEKEKEMIKEKNRGVVFFEDAKTKINEHENFAQSVKFIVDLFNSEISTSSANKAFGIIGSRATANLLLLLEQDWFRVEANWFEYFKKIKQSDFLMGKAGRTKFVLSLDWVIDPENAGKILNGKYENLDKISNEIFIQDALDFFKNKYGENL